MRLRLDRPAFPVFEALMERRRRATQIRFTTNFSGGSAGREQYFLRSGAASVPPSATPEPGTLLLLGTGALALIRRKVQSM